MHIVPKKMCFAFGGATVRFASLETSFHAANHTIPPPPSYEGLPRCPKDKNHSPFHGEKTPDDKMISDIQYGIKIMGGREVSRPYRVWFFAEGERFLSF